MPNLSTYHEARLILNQLRPVAQPSDCLAPQPEGEAGPAALIAGLSHDEFAAVAAESRPASPSPA